MSLYVVDSSVAVKWYVPEIPRCLRPPAPRQRCRPACPRTFLDVGVAAILWKKIPQRRSEPGGDARRHPEAARGPHGGHPPNPPCRSSPRRSNLADRSGRTVYDCLLSRPSRCNSAA